MDHHHIIYRNEKFWYIPIKTTKNHLVSLRNGQKKVSWAQITFAFTGKLINTALVLSLLDFHWRTKQSSSK